MSGAAPRRLTPLHVLATCVGAVVLAGLLHVREVTAPPSLSCPLPPCVHCRTDQSSPRGVGPGAPGEGGARVGGEPVGRVVHWAGG
jgi:hypothetical protein